ncbi:hypothetical protein [Methylobacterium fujisawaense]|uniref:hypothetical protein n=1 Tax=Methylobacterium fujisawaense TaxID=107400 RepID=UPI002447E329|nr:hypothetical protein [Methylobacterium fujisawaense]MDH3027321.1 hypothetical protein [Methylobacterium fujisawaense]
MVQSRASRFELGVTSSWRVQARCTVSSTPSSAHASSAMSEKAFTRRPTGFAQEDAFPNAYF